MKAGSSLIPPHVVAAFPTLSDAAVRLVAALGRFMNRKGQCFPGTDTLRHAAGIKGWGRFYNARHELEGKGLLTCKRRGRASCLYAWANSTTVVESDTHPDSTDSVEPDAPSSTTPVEPGAAQFYEIRTSGSTTAVELTPQRTQERKKHPQTPSPESAEHGGSSKAKRPPSKPGKPTADGRRVEAADRLIATYRATITRPGDYAKARARNNITAILKAGEHDEAALTLAVERYAETCEALGAEPQYRYACANFFGPKAEHYRDFLADDWEAPTPIDPAPDDDAFDDGISQEAYEKLNAKWAQDGTDASLRAHLAEHMEPDT